MGVLLKFSDAKPEDAAAIAGLQNAAAGALTARYGEGHWSSLVSERGAALAQRHARVRVGRAGKRIYTVLRLATRKPWAIDVAYFTPVRRPLYLTGMAVSVAHQAQGLGRQALQDAIAVARTWPADAIRLDAYDAEAGAGQFYASCGFQERGRVVYRNDPLVYYELLSTRPDGARHERPSGTADSRGGGGSRLREVFAAYGIEGEQAASWPSLPARRRSTMTGLVFRETQEADVESLFEVRARTRENPISREQLARMGITPASSAAALRSGEQKGWVCLDGPDVVGFCSADGVGGEVLVLAVLPEYEGRGVGRRLLAHAVDWLRARGCGRVWLAASPDPAIRAHGFYRSQGWRPTGERDGNGDEILVLEGA